MDLNITKYESTAFQALNTAKLLFYSINDPITEKNIVACVPFNPLERHFFNQVGLGNPAMLQTILYLLLVIPKELQKYCATLVDATAFNSIAFSIIESGTHSTYQNESSNENINYYHHLRNAVAHSSCEYAEKIEPLPEPYVIFRDRNDKKNETCQIKIKCSNILLLIEELIRQIDNYFDNKIKGN